MKTLAIFDIGGTSLQYQIYQNEQLIVENELSVQKKNKDEVLQMISRIIKDNNAEHIALSSPGAVNSETGYISGLTGIEGYSNFNLYESLKGLNDNIQTIIAMNDANAALYGNTSLTPVKNAVQITVGTGIGGAILINNKIYEGKNGYGGEFGYAPIGRDSSRSRKISTNALVERVNSKSESKFKNAKEIMENLSAKVLELYNAWINDLANYIIDLEYTFDPNVIFVAGGISRNKKFQSALDQEINKIIKEYQYPNHPKIIYSAEQNVAIFGMLNLLKETIK